MYKVYGMATSGNCHKVRLLLEQLGVPYEWHEVDILAGALAMNPNGKVPVLKLDSGRFLAE